jgi:hypothetical protein
LFELSFQAIVILSGVVQERLTWRTLLGATRGASVGVRVGVRVRVAVGNGLTVMVTCRVIVPPQPRAVSV